MLYQRKVGNSWLGVREGVHSNLAGGKAHKATGYDTVYVVVAMANGSRSEVALGTFPSLRTATMFIDCYSPRYGLVTKG